MAKPSSSQSQQASDGIIAMRVAAWSGPYEKPGFQDALNKKARSFLDMQGINVKIMGPPQGAGAEGRLTLLLKILSLLVKVFPAIRKAQKRYYERTYRVNRPKFTIMLEAHGVNNKFDRDKK
jgi:hypothetical protein